MDLQEINSVRNMAKSKAGRAREGPDIHWRLIKGISGVLIYQGCVNGRVIHDWAFATHVTTGLAARVELLVRAYGECQRWSTSSHCA